MNKNSIYIVMNVFIPFMAAYFLSELFRNINGIVGIYLDRYGARRTVSFLLIFAAFGALAVPTLPKAGQPQVYTEIPFY